MMTEDPFLTMRKGGEHTVGPLTISYERFGDGQPAVAIRIKKQGDTKFLLDQLDGEAIIFAIKPSAHLWKAEDNDQELQAETGEKRGWLWLRLPMGDVMKPLEGWAGHQFRVGRLVTEAGTGEKVVRPTGPQRTADYRRPSLGKVGGAARKDDRMSFIHCCSVLARHHRPDLPKGWVEELKARFALADTLAITIREMEQENDDL